MNNVVDEVISGTPKYTITFNDNSKAVGVTIELENTVLQQGTELNKFFFDSILDDLNSRLLATNKATQVDVQTGTNNSKYVTPKSLNSTILKESGSFSSRTETKTIYTFDNSMTGRIVITGFIKGKAPNSEANWPTPTAYDGACIVLLGDTEVFNSVQEADEGFQMVIDFDLKSIHYLGKYTTVNKTGSSPATYAYNITNKNVIEKFTTLDTLKIKGSNWRITDTYSVVIRRDY